jgi:P27 family predicted phage terminase small subunit
MPGGRPRKPTALHVVEGTTRADRENPDEPRPELGAQRPFWLTKRGVWAWKKLAPRLVKTRILTELDAEALALLCDAYADYLEARAIVAREGLTYESATESGGTMIRPRPEVDMKARAWARVEKMLSNFGATPAARAKVHAAAEGDLDPFESFLGRRKA